MAVRPTQPSFRLLLLGALLLPMAPGCSGDASLRSSDAEGSPAGAEEAPAANAIPEAEATLAVPPGASAREVLDAALVTASRTQRLVFLHSGASW